MRRSKKSDAPVKIEIPIQGEPIKQTVIDIPPEKPKKTRSKAKKKNLSDEKVAEVSELYAMALEAETALMSYKTKVASIRTAMRFLYSNLVNSMKRLAEKLDKKDVNKEPIVSIRERMEKGICDLNNYASALDAFCSIDDVTKLFDEE